MGDPKGFLNYKRVTAQLRPVHQRVLDFQEVNERLGEQELRRQGARCMDCGIPYCHALGCPLGNLIPEWNDAVFRGDWYEAFTRLEKTNDFPEITGRVCPAPCEDSCTLAINDDAVSIKEIELAVIEYAFRRGWVLPVRSAGAVAAGAKRAETGKRVAVVGSGPAGLSAARQLRVRGHEVTVFEREQEAGGILRYGIPGFKLEKQVLERRIDLLRQGGVNFETGVTIGADLSARYLFKKFDAVLLATGAGTPRDLDVPGRGLEGVVFAMDYLGASAVHSFGVPAHMNARDRDVLVIGGGDTGSDCVGTAIRQGASTVTQVEILPKPEQALEPGNPRWPYRPGTLKTSSSHQEGCERRWNTGTLSFASEYGRVERTEIADLAWKTDKNGRRSFEVIPGSEHWIKTDLVVLAMGFLHTEHGQWLDELGIALDERGNIKHEAYRCNEGGVFVAGDAAAGASLVVTAFHHGREAARQVDEYLVSG